MPALRNVRARARYLGDLRYTVLEGTTLPITIETPIDTNLQGRVRGFVNQPVYASDARVVLIPTQTRIYGEYVSNADAGARRVFVIWSRLVTPQGIEIQLDSTGVDSLGRAGLPATRDSRFFERFGASVLLSIIGGFAQQQSDDSRQQYYLSESFNNAATVALENTINIRPVLKTPAGLRAQAFVNRDLDFATAYRALRRHAPGQAPGLRKTVYAPVVEQAVVQGPAVAPRPVTAPGVPARGVAAVDTRGGQAVPPGGAACGAVRLVRGAMLSALARAYLLACGFTAVSWQLGAPGRYADYRIVSDADVALPGGADDFLVWLGTHFNITAVQHDDARIELQDTQ